MRNTIFLLLTGCLMAVGAMAQPGPGYWQQQANYTISVALNDETHTLDGHATIEYTNHSPDSLPFLWVHLWPNAYKNDKTAFSEQHLQGGALDFYFSNSNEKGYINRLDFKVGGTSVLVEDHPQYIDVVKVLLPSPLTPGGKVVITTPFHVKLPYLYSRMGHVGQHYVLAQWYPKLAVYDQKGWHPMPYLGWGEYHNDFGDYQVTITLPKNYVVGATGSLQGNEEKEWMKTRTKPVDIPKPAGKKKELFATNKKQPEFPASATSTKTLEYKASNVTDFAWMADKRFLVKYDTLQLGGRVVEAWNLLLPQDEENWRNSMAFTKRALRFYSNELGAYPHPQITVADAKNAYDGMEYPMIATLDPAPRDEQALDLWIAHEVGHNWLQGILASNERQHPWMDEGMNSYYERKYQRQYYPGGFTMPKAFFAKKMPADSYQALLDRAYSTHTDQPIETPAEEITFGNNQAVYYNKTAQWMELMEEKLGQPAMRKLMQDYYEAWKFKHPYPEDFKEMVGKNTGELLEDHFALLYQTGPLEQASPKKPTRITGFFNLRNTADARYIGLAPAIGYNVYDKLEIGILAHNYNNPSSPLQFVVAPMLATGSKQLVGLGRLGYTWHGGKKFQKMELYAAAARFNFGDGGIQKDIAGETLRKAFTKLTPGIYLEWKNKSPLSTMRRWADFKTYFISEQTTVYKELYNPPIDTTSYIERGAAKNTIIPQLTFGWANERKLYPWSVELGFQQVKQIVRSTVTAKYFLNYNEKGQGLAARLFFGKIFYTRQKTDALRGENSRYHFFMYGPNMDQDYTYSDVFADRNQGTGIFGRQIMLRDAAFKYRTDYGGGNPGLSLEDKEYYFDNWLASVNLTLDVPDKVNPLAVLPVKTPLKVFADIGTSHIPWRQNSAQPKFLYSMGLQLVLFKCLNIYYPLIQSKEFKDPISNNGGGEPAKWWQKRLTFSVDINGLKQKAKGMFVL